jgi:hypothetical protein
MVVAAAASSSSSGSLDGAAGHVTESQSVLCGCQQIFPVSRDAAQILRRGAQ